MTLRVFLVEDSAVIRENLSAALEELAPVEVVGFAEDESAATSWVVANPEALDLIVIDIFLTQGSGLGVLRGIMGLSDICKVVLSNYATTAMRSKCLKLGAQRVFDKSKEFEAFVEYCSRLHGGETGFGGLGP